MSQSPGRRILLPLCMGLLVAGCSTVPPEPSDHGTVLARQALPGASPATSGSLPVGTFYYGRGDDKNRVEYRDSVLLETSSVDASDLVDLGSSADSRNEYWGFSPDSFPVNGRVWYPAEGDGPFPLVLVVHGNHDMRDFSDPGYDYLGEHLASRGYVLASVDMNFLNGGIRGENDARGWMLLKHLEAWEEMLERDENPLQGRVDMDRIALMGHSRGGEAVAVAAALNRLSRYPDDATVAFDFGFRIRSIVAIAPVDGQYRPAEQPTPVKNVSYLVFHGSHDGDVTSFHGLRQYKRVTLDPDSAGFKAAVYVYRANHGQWNTVWGANDNGTRSDRILELDALIPAEDQRAFALIYVTAFLEATLKDNLEYLPLFVDHRVAGDWLPPTMYVTRYRDASFHPLAEFEEDIDVTTGTGAGVRISGDSLSEWSEATLALRSRNRTTTSASQESQAVWLGWNRRVRGSEELREAPRYTLTLPDGLAGDWRLDAASTLDLLLVAREGKPRLAAGEEGEGREGKPEDPGGEGAREGVEGDGSPESSEEEPLDLSVRLEDGAGRWASVPLSRYGPVRRPLETWILRRKDLEEDRFAEHFEMVLQSFALPLGDFLQEEPDLDLGDLRVVELVFDRTEAGRVVVDEIGFSRPDPAALSHRVSGPGG